jgi:plastocyanin
MTRKLRWLLILPTLAALALSALLVHQAMASPTQQASGKNWSALVGAQVYTEGEGSKPSWQMEKFYPITITINVSDTITWKFNSGFEPHTVTFLAGAQIPEALIPDPDAGQSQGGPPALIVNPQVLLPAGGNSFDGSAFTSSGIVAEDVPGPKEYTLSFTKAGTYDYVCLLHAGAGPDGVIQGMKATVVVLDAGAALPLTPEQVVAAENAAIEVDRKAAADKQATLPQPPAATTNADGSMTHHAYVGYAELGPNSIMEYQRFWPENLNINQGDTVSWSLPTGGFHTVTFGEEPELFNIEPQASGPPKAKINPLVFPAGGTTHTGTGYYNSGPLAGPDDPPEAGPKTYSLTFAQAGRYEYICIPHYHLGMDATVTVLARTGGGTGGGTGGETGGGNVPGMPTTGNADNWTPLALAALLAVLTLGAGLALRKRATR